MTPDQLDRLVMGIIIGIVVCSTLYLWRYVKQLARDIKGLRLDPDKPYHKVPGEWYSKEKVTMTYTFNNWRLRVFIVGPNPERIQQFIQDHYTEVSRHNGYWQSHDDDGYILLIPICSERDSFGIKANLWPMEQRVIFLPGWELDKSPEFKSRIRRLARDVEFAERRRSERNQMLFTDPPRP